MLPKSARLNLKYSFKKVSSGKRAETAHLKIMYIFEGDNPPLVGVAISSKSFKKAVERNKAKRVVFGAAALRYSELQRGLNLVIMPKPTVLESNVEAIAKELDEVKVLFSTSD